MTGEVAAAEGYKLSHKHEWVSPNKLVLIRIDDNS